MHTMLCFWTLHIIKHRLRLLLKYPSLKLPNHIDVNDNMNLSQCVEFVSEGAFLFSFTCIFTIHIPSHLYYTVSRDNTDEINWECSLD